MAVCGPLCEDGDSGCRNQSWLVSSVQWYLGRRVPEHWWELPKTLKFFTDTFHFQISRSLLAANHLKNVNKRLFFFLAKQKGQKRKYWEIIYSSSLREAISCSPGWPGVCYVAEDDLELPTLLSLPSEFWEDRCDPCTWLRNKANASDRMRAMSQLAKTVINERTSPAWWQRLVIPATCKSEAGGWTVQNASGLQNEFKSSLDNLIYIYF